MHAGEALWTLYASLSAIGQRTLKDSGVGMLLAEAEKCCDIIGEHIQVAPPPTDQKVVRASALLEGLKTERDDENAASSITSGEAREAYDLATGILADIEELPEEAAEFAESVGEKVKSIRAYVERFDRVTPGQYKALQNIRGGVDRWMR